MSPHASDILFLLGVLVCIAVVLVIVGIWIHHRLVRSNTGNDQWQTAFSLADLHRIKAQDQMTQEEYNRAKAAVIAREAAATTGQDDLDAGL